MFFGIPQAVLAQDAAEDEAEDKKDESAVPIDVVSAEEIVNQGETDLSNLIRTVVPSFNVNTQPISDAATVVRPASRRNLAPDHTLVLVNNKRRHRAAGIYWLGNGVADGAQGPDISSLSMEEDVKRHFSRDRHALASGVDPRIWQCLTFGGFPLRQFRL